MAGGSAFVSAGGFVRSLEKEFKSLGIDLTEEFEEAEKELNVAQLSENLISEGSKSIALASEKLGYRMTATTKAINPLKCVRCGNCTFGCQTGAKWTPLVYLNEALKNGVEIMYNTDVGKIIAENGSVKGVILHYEGKEIFIGAEKVILSAGGLGTPVILQSSGIKEAGSNLFIDTHVNVYGIHKSLNLIHEPQMSMINLDFYENKGFIIATFVNHPRLIKFIEAGVKGLLLSPNNTLGLMIMIKDEASGLVYADGSVSKSITVGDKEKITEGIAFAKDILKASGCSSNTFVITHAAGSHPGGTAAIGTVVDTNLETEIRNLFICDASIFPQSPGLPMILTIISLAKRLAKIIG